MRAGVGIAVLMMVQAVVALAAPTGMVPEDTYRLRVPSALEVAPDGTTVVYGLEIADEVSNQYTHQLWLTDIQGRAARRIGPKGADVSAPQFSPDGQRLAFLVDTGAGSQLWVGRRGGSGARAVTQLKAGVEAFDWSPDGTRFVIVTSDPDKRTDEAKQLGPIIVTRTQIQSDGAGYLDERRSHLWIVPSSAKGAPRQITSGPYDDSQPQWAPDGRSIAFVSNRAADPDTTDNTDIYTVSPQGGEARLLVATPGPDSFPTWSHDGKTLAFVGTKRPNDFYQTTLVMTVPATGGTPTARSAALDTWVAADALNVSSSRLARLNWTSDDRTLITSFERRGANYLAAIDLESGAIRELHGGRFVLSLPRLVPGDKQLLFAQEDAAHPAELFSKALDDSAPCRLTSLHQSLLAERALVTPEKIVATNPEGQPVEAWLYPPLERKAGQKYPLVLYIHGGPQGFDGDYFDVGLENQILPAQGLAVLRVNYRGSTSYGEAFCHALWGDWHHREYDDLMAAVDKALEQPWLDPQRLGLGGWSYGGIMTIWTVGHTDRFKVGVPERFEVDYLSCFGQDQWFAQYLTEFGSPFEAREKYDKYSPGSYAQNIKTPLYLISNEKDGNCPLPQAMQFYQRLKLLGVPTQLTIYPGEPHVMTQPKHLVDRLHRLVEWFGRHLN